MGGVPLPPLAARAARRAVPRHPERAAPVRHRASHAVPRRQGSRCHGAQADARPAHRPADRLLRDGRLPRLPGLVDALGGVTLDIPHAVLDRVSPYERGGEWIRIDLQPGRQHLDADQAFAYVRARSTSSDWARIKRQRCVIAAIADAAGPTTVLRSPPDQNVRQNFQHGHPGEAAARARQDRHVDPHEPGRLDRLHAARVHLRRHGRRAPPCPTSRPSARPGPRCSSRSRPRRPIRRTIGGGACLLMRR